jgi:hypothetical protein
MSEVFSLNVKRNKLQNVSITQVWHVHFFFNRLENQTTQDKRSKWKKVKFALEQAMKAQRASRGIALLFL